jgi:glycosyltransferase involved in cell wall biosynthesis
MALAVALLPDDMQARLIVAGRVDPSLMESLAAEGTLSDRIDVVGWVDPPAVSALLRQARVGLCVLHPTPAYVESVPTKLFEYMAAGIPVIASDFRSWRRVVKESGCGLLVDPLDPAAIAQAAVALLSDPEAAHEMGMRGRAEVESRYNWEREGERLVECYEALM